MNDDEPMRAADIAAAVNGRKIDAVELITEFGQRIEASRGLNALITETVARATALARTSHQRGGPLAGVPLVVKDMFDTAGVRTTYGSALYADHVPVRTATAVRRLQQAGALVLGKANQHEFAWGLTSRNPHWGDVRNPAHPDRTPGGSSGGNAAALAARLCVLGLGTDTGGSVRVPAACCDVVGFKPSHGTISMAGCRPLVPSYDCVGPMARTVADCLLCWQVLVDDHRELPSYVAGLRTASYDELPEAEVLAAAGATVTAQTLPPPPEGTEDIFGYEAARTHASTFPAQRARYSADGQVKWDAARRVGKDAYHRGLVALSSWRRQVADLGLDLVVLPASPRPVPAFDVDELAVRSEFGRYARLANQLGWAALAYGSVQVMGPDDRKVLAAAQVLESALPLPR